MSSLEESSLWSGARKSLSPYAAIPLRLIVGYGFVAHGLAKWSRGPGAFAGILHAIGVPVPHLMAWITIVTEIAGGIAILIGAFVSLASIPAIILLAVAIFTVHLPYGFSSIKLMSVVNGRAQFGPPGYECDLLYIAAIVALALNSPSPWSVDNYRLRQARASSQLSDSTVVNYPAATRLCPALGYRRSSQAIDDSRTRAHDSVPLLHRTPSQGCSRGRIDRPNAGRDCNRCHRDERRRRYHPFNTSACWVTNAMRIFS